MDHHHDAPADILDMLASHDHHSGFDINLVEGSWTRHSKVNGTIMVLNKFEGIKPLCNK